MNSLRNYKWNYEKNRKVNYNNLSNEFGLPLILTKILVSRNILDIQSLNNYINPTYLGLYSPFYFRDMNKAIERIELAIKNNEAVLIFGDRDVDGITATAILYKFFSKYIQNLIYRVPEGSEDYGITKDVIRWASTNDITLIITVDCGITSIEEVNYAKTLGIDIIITDHHEQRDVIPNAVAVINPKIKDDNYPFPNLSGAITALKLTCGFLEKKILSNYNKVSVFFDIETTGLNPSKDKITEIAAVKVINGVIIDRFQTLLKIDEKIPQDIAKKTGITDEMLEKEGIEPKEALIKFNEFIENHTIIGHNVIDFDLKFLNNYFKKYLNKNITNQVEDTLKLSRIILKKNKQFSLSEVAKSLGIYFDETKLHRSLADSELAAEVYRRLLILQNDRYREHINEYISLAAIGTIADVMPLVDENRNIVKNGLKNISYAPTGLITLIRRLNLNIENLTVKDISWNVSPILNSPGRLGDASLSVELLVSSKLKENEELLDQIIEIDKERKSIVEKCLNDVMSNLNQEEIEKNNFIFIYSPDIVRGTTGLISSKLNSRFLKTSIVISTENNQITGSIRSKGDIDVVSMLEYCKDLLLMYGGHKNAGGFSIAKENLEVLKERLIQYFSNIKNTNECKVINIDTVIEDLDEVNLNIYKIIQKYMEPFGSGNEPPKLLFSNVQIDSVKKIGKKNEHIVFNITKNNKTISAVCWNAGEEIDNFFKDKEIEKLRFDIIGELEIANYMNKEELRVNTIDIIQR